MVMLEELEDSSDELETEDEEELSAEELSEDELKEDEEDSSESEDDELEETSLEACDEVLLCEEDSSDDSLSEELFTPQALSIKKESSERATNACLC